MKKKIAVLVNAVLLFNMCSGYEISAKAASMDLNNDGYVNVFDCITLRRNSNKNADFNNDTYVDVNDYHALNGFLVKKYIPPVEDNEAENKNPIDESAILEPKGTVHYGEGTFYGGGYEGGCAMLDPISQDDYWIVAMNLTDYNNAQLAGAYIEVTGELGTINMLVTDLLPEGKKGDLDLYVDAFPLIAPAEKGRVPVSWKIIPLDSAENAPVSFKFKEGSSAYWCGVQVRNHRYPVTKLEYMDENGQYVELPRKQYNFFESDKMGAGPFNFRITDIYGQVITEENIELVPEGIVQGKNQFPF